MVHHSNFQIECWVSYMKKKNDKRMKLYYFVFLENYNLGLFKSLVNYHILNKCIPRLYCRLTTTEIVAKHLSIV